MALKPVSVSQLNGYIKRILGTDPILLNVSVVGEIFNLTKHSTGHWYFSLKDENSKINCFLPRDKAEQLRYEIDEGMRITAYGSVSVYMPGGYYSLNIRDLEPEGEGALKAAYEKLKAKLNSEGLFDESRKRELPEFPKRIGVVTSPTGAAIKDIITTVKRRNPLVDVLLYPCIVQGADAAGSIVSGIKTLNSEFPDLDLIIVGRGGGSAEDLWAFNEESVVRAVADSKLPVISAVGHEIDFVLTDFAADVRGATPTAAAELAVPHIDVYKDILRRCSPERLYQDLYAGVERNVIQIKHYREIAEASIESILSDAAHRINMLKLDLEAYNPRNQLDKGYAIAKSIDGKWISSVNNIDLNDKLEIILKDGTLDCLVTGVNHG